MKNITYTNNKIIFHTRLRQYDVEYDRDITVDLDGKWLQNGCLLAAVLEELINEKKMNHNHALNWRFAIINCMNNHDISWMLKKKPNELSPQNIIDIHTTIENEIEKLNISSSYMKSNSSRFIFAREGVTLKNGDSLLVIHQNFKSRFYAGPIKSLRSQPTENSAIPFTNIEELNECVEHSYKERINKIISACQSDIEEHINIIKNIKELKSTPTNNNTEEAIGKIFSRSILCNAITKSNHSPLHINSRIIHIHNLKIETEMIKYIDCKGSNRWYNTGSCKEYLFYRFLKPDHTGSFKNDLGILLADIFLPRRISLACLIILQLTTGCNASTIRSLTKSRVIKTKIGYTLLGIKTKTDKLVKSEINIKQDPIACIAIELLLDNDINIDKYWNRENPSIFCTWSYGRTFKLARIHKTLARFIKWHNLEPFLIDDLRDLFAQHDFLVHKDPFRVQGLLNHMSISTTDQYLNDTVLTTLREANINEFMRRLAPSIAYSIDSNYMLTKGFDENKIDKNLLFPVSTYNGVTPAISDQWLMDQEKYNFVIDNNIVYLCAYQRLYYTNNLDKLISNNSDRFIHYHLPRILFCISLYNIIKNSEYGVLLEKIEGEFNES